MGLLARLATGATRQFVDAILAELGEEIRKARVMQKPAVADTLTVIHGVIERVFVKE